MFGVASGKSLGLDFLDFLGCEGAALLVDPARFLGGIVSVSMFVNGTEEEMGASVELVE